MLKDDGLLLEVLADILENQSILLARVDHGAARRANKSRDYLRGLARELSTAPSDDTEGE